MKTVQKAVIAATIAVAIGTCIFEAHRASKAKAELASLLREQMVTPSVGAEMEALRKHLRAATNSLRSLEKENEELRRQAREIHRLRGEIGVLRKSMSEVKDSKNPPEDTNSVKVAAQSWLNRVDQLRRRFEALPDQKIPELELLNDDDWLAATKTALVTEDDYRRSMSRLRGIAENKVAEILHTGLRKYRAANNERVPADIFEFQHFIDTPIDQKILERYSIYPPNIIPNVTVSGDWVISQKAPVDAEHDMRFVLGSSGGRGSGPFKGERRSVR